MRFQCLTCNGAYDDGSEKEDPYYHVCPEGKIEGNIADGTRQFVPFVERRDENLVEENPGSIKSEGKGRLLLREE